MFHKLLFSVLFLFAALPVFAQDGGDGAAKQKIQSLKVSFITDRLQLTPQQSARFWPIYNQYEDDRRTARREARKNCLNANPNMDRVAAQNCVDANMEYQQKTLDLRKKYKDRLLQVISAQQLVTLYQAEQDFKTIILQVLREKQN